MIYHPSDIYDFILRPIFGPPILRSFIIVFLLVFANHLPAQETNVSNLETMREPLEVFAASMSSAQLDYIESKEGIDCPSYYGGPTIYHFYIDANRFYVKMESQYPNELKPRIHEEAFDGTTFYLGDPSDSPDTILPKMQRYQPGDTTDSSQNGEIVAFQSSYLTEAGFYLPESISDLRTYQGVESLLLDDINSSDTTKVQSTEGGLRISVHVPDPLIIRARGINLEDMRNQMELGHIQAKYILRAINALQSMQDMDKWHNVIFTVDPKKGYAITKREEFSPDSRLTVSSFSDQWIYYPQTKVWLPGRCTTSYYTPKSLYTDFSDQPRMTVIQTLNKAVFGLQTNVSFVLDYKDPRTMIIDHSTSQAKENPDHQAIYTVGVDESTLRNDTDVALDEMKARRKRAFFLVVFLATTVLPLIGISIALILQRKKD